MSFFRGRKGRKKSSVSEGAAINAGSGDFASLNSAADYGTTNAQQVLDFYDERMRKQDSQLEVLSKFLESIKEKGRTIGDEIRESQGLLDKMEDDIDRAGAGLRRNTRDARNLAGAQSDDEHGCCKGNPIEWVANELTHRIMRCFSQK